jgi:hypothetical protein
MYMNETIIDSKPNPYVFGGPFSRQISNECPPTNTPMTSIETNNSRHNSPIPPSFRPQPLPSSMVITWLFVSPAGSMFQTFPIICQGQGVVSLRL